MRLFKHWPYYQDITILRGSHWSPGVQETTVAFTFSGWVGWTCITITASHLFKQRLQ